MEYFNYAQLVLGPAGSGKSTYCKIVQEHGIAQKRTIKVVNLDPAAENFNYECNINIQELIKVNDVMEKKRLGPNGALIYCMEYLAKNLSWLTTQFEKNGDEVYYLFDCPGQLELYSHYNIMKVIMNFLKKSGFSICSIFCLDSTFLQEQSKFVSGNVLSLATMVQMELPHLTILTKCDLISESHKEILEKIDEGIEPKGLIDELNPFMGKKMSKLNAELISFIDNYSLIDLHPMNINDEDSINAVLYNADLLLQYIESQEPKDEVYAQAEMDIMPQIDEENQF